MEIFLVKHFVSKNYTPVREMVQIFSKEKNEAMNEDAKDQIKNYYIAEIENLQNQVRTVEESKDKLIALHKEEKNRIITERNEIESMFNQMKIEKENLEKDFVNFKNFNTKQLFSII